MKLTQALTLINNKKLDVLKNTIRMTVAEAPQFLGKVKENRKIVYNKINDLNKWYTKVIGLDEVKLYQDKVTALQEQLLNTQEKRREVGRQLADVRQKSLELQDEIHKVKRQEDLARFLDLMKEETEILRLESSISRTFQDYDQTERELFTAFTNAIPGLSREAEGAGSFLAFMYTTLRKQDLKKFIEEKLVERSMAEPVVLKLVEANQRNLDEIMRNRQALNGLMKALTDSEVLSATKIKSNTAGKAGSNVTALPLQTNEYTIDLHLH
ncbi:hypothetical protein NQ318_005807 [Aromia moschata]|uniref:Uncharacterized protein n=1 Tax=Aromia moschata TaxID=1265417 RepID=A0AAV8YT32_9CUCU|nr:hypothetical protein NQ318_005807 [Aromia moschata]